MFFKSISLAMTMAISGAAFGNFISVSSQTNGGSSDLAALRAIEAILAHNLNNGTLRLVESVSHGPEHSSRCFEDFSNELDRVLEADVYMQLTRVKANDHNTFINVEYVEKCGN